MKRICTIRRVKSCGFYMFWTSDKVFSLSLVFQSSTPRLPRLFYFASKYDNSFYFIFLDNSLVVKVFLFLFYFLPTIIVDSLIGISEGSNNLSRPSFSLSTLKKKKKSSFFFSLEFQLIYFTIFLPQF